MTWYRLSLGIAGGSPSLSSRRRRSSSFTTVVVTRSVEPSNLVRQDSTTSWNSASERAASRCAYEESLFVTPISRSVKVPWSPEGTTGKSMPWRRRPTLEDVSASSPPSRRAARIRISAASISRDRVAGETGVGAQPLRLVVHVLRLDGGARLGERGPGRGEGARGCVDGLRDARARDIDRLAAHQQRDAVDLAGRGLRVCGRLPRAGWSFRRDRASRDSRSTQIRRPTAAARRRTSPLVALPFT